MIMTVLLLFFMARQLTGDSAHEWLGAAMLILWIAHHIFEPELVQPSFQRKIYACTHFSDRDKLCCVTFHARFNGKRDHTFQRSFCFPADSRRDRSGKAITCAFRILGICADGSASRPALEYDPGHGAQSCRTGFFKPLRILLRIAAVLVAGYGFYAFLKNQFLSYMFLTSSFVFFDFERPVLLFFTEYLAIMGLFIFLAHYASRGIQKLTGRR